MSKWMKRILIVCSVLLLAASMFERKPATNYDVYLVLIIVLNFVWED